MVMALTAEAVCRPAHSHRNFCLMWDECRMLVFRAFAKNICKNNVRPHARFINRFGILLKFVEKFRFIHTRQ